MIKDSEGRRKGGSSPHTRGTLHATFQAQEGDRFIPAYAGNAWRPTAAIGAATVHPRIRGERSSPQRARSRSAGSSPHTRGTRRRRYVPQGLHRFIPAYAGNASTRKRLMASVTVHPRIRGERSEKPAARCLGIGSSPHTRGTPTDRPRRCLQRRFIPAYAGNACGRPAAERQRSVHPRIRGERRITQRARGPAAGSSPHTRGTLLGIRSPAVADRFIPAYAGNAAPHRPAERGHSFADAPAP